MNAAKLVKEAILLNPARPSVRCDVGSHSPTTLRVAFRHELMRLNQRDNWRIRVGNGEVYLEPVAGATRTLTLPTGTVTPAALAALRTLLNEGLFDEIRVPTSEDVLRETAPEELSHFMRVEGQPGLTLLS